MTCDRPNIVMIVCHDLGQHLGCYGAGLQTPHIDAIARGGALFTNYHCTAAQCSPSRGSIMTGKYPHNNGLVGLAHIGWEYNPGETTLQMYLSQAGYTTHLFGVQHETGGDATDLGYQYVEARGSAALPLAGDLAQWLQARAAGGEQAPFFACLGTGEPHRPYRREGYRADDPEQVQLLPWLPDRPGIRGDIAQLNGLVYALDEAVGTVTRALEQTGLSEDTLLIFTTDHGIAMPRAKCTCYDPGTKTALAMRLPGRWDRGAVHDELLTNCDLLPTITELIAEPPPTGIDGRSFLGLLDGADYTPRDSIFTEMTYHGVYNPMRCIRTNSHKYIRNFGQLPLVYMPTDIMEWPAGSEMLEEYCSSSRPEEELYDLRDDPLEMTNIAGEPSHADTLADLRGKVDGWMNDTGDLLLEGRWPSNPEHARRLGKMFRTDRFKKWMDYYTHDQIWFLDAD